MHTMPKRPARRTKGARPKKRGRRRARARVLGPADIVRVDSEVRTTTKNSRSDETLRVYESYLNGIHDWYRENKSSLRTPNGKANASKIRRL